MNTPTKTNPFKALLERKLAAQAARNGVGVIADSDLSRKFDKGEKAQPIIRRGGRNGSGKP